MKSRTLMIAAAALAAGLTLTACSSSDDTTATPTTTETTEVIIDETIEDETGLPPVPTVEELNARLQMALDPAVPAEEKAQMVAGLEHDPALIQELSEAAAQARAEGLIDSIEVVGPVLETGTDVINVPFEVVFEGNVNAGDVVIVASDGEWKLGKDSVCGLAAIMDIPAESCQM